MDILVTILYAVPVYQCVILALLLFAGNRQLYGYSRLIMGFFQFLLAFYFSFNLLYRLKAFELLTFVYYGILPVILSFIPVFYLYILSITTPEFRFNRRHLIHLIPSLIILLLNSPYLFFSYEDKLSYITHGNSMLNNHAHVRYMLIIYIIGIYGICNLQLVYYLFRTIRLYRNHKQYIVNHYSYTENIDISWIPALIIAFVSFFILNNVLYIIGFKQHLFSQVFYTVSMLGITLFAGIQGMRQKELEHNLMLVKFKPPDRNAAVVDCVPNKLPESTEQERVNSSHIEDKYHNEIDPDNSLIQNGTEYVSPNEKYSGSTLSATQKQVFIQKLETLMITEKLFIIDNLSVEHVADKLGTNSKYVSQVINEYYRKNFYNFINSYRVEEAKRLLLESVNEKYSILGIARIVGFVSKSTFNSAFKRFTGMTPSEYKKNNSNG
jgi:AraC-like DNA-binding protein